MSGSAESRADRLLDGLRGQAMLADLAGLDPLMLLAAEGKPPPAGEAAVASTIQARAERPWRTDPLALLASVARAAEQWEPPLPGGQAGLLRAPWAAPCGPAGGTSVTCPRSGSPESLEGGRLCHSGPGAR